MPADDAMWAGGRGWALWKALITIDSPDATPAAASEATRVAADVLAEFSVSKHLACLRDCRLVDFRTEGRQSFYSLPRPELIDLLRSAELLLARTGEAVALCPVYGGPAVAEPVDAVS